MNFRGGPGGTRRAELAIDLTPMIDCVFTLVLFLAVQVNFDPREQNDKTATSDMPAIQVDLPRSSAQAVVADKQDINVWVASDGVIYLGEVPADNAALRSAFAAAAKKNAGTLVIIKADKGVSHGKVVGVMDLARNAGLSRLAIATALGDEGGRF